MSVIFLTLQTKYWCHSASVIQEKSASNPVSVLFLNSADNKSIEHSFYASWLSGLFLGGVEEK